jgi:hypothetical protein
MEGGRRQGTWNAPSDSATRLEVGVTKLHRARQAYGVFMPYALQGKAHVEPRTTKRSAGEQVSLEAEATVGKVILLGSGDATLNGPGHSM